VGELAVLDELAEVEQPQRTLGNCAPKATGSYRTPSARQLENSLDSQTELGRPPSSEYGTHKTVKARFWPWLSGEVSRGEKMLESGTDPESYITEYTFVYEDRFPLCARADLGGQVGELAVLDEFTEVEQPRLDRVGDLVDQNQHRVRDRLRGEPMKITTRMR